MSDHTAQFTGDIPGYYDRCLGPVMFEPYAADLVSRLPNGEGLRVLETACGSGIVTRRIREALPDSATLVATDLNEGMVDFARAAVLDERITWQPADAQALPFQDGAFDVLVCQFGLIFLPDKPLGFREARRVLAPGGRLLANVWLPLEQNEYALTAHRHVTRLFPDDPPRFFETPFGYSDRAALTSDLTLGGWEEFNFDDVRFASPSPTAADLATGFVLGSPLTFQLLERGADLPALIADLAAELAALGGAEPFTANLAATVITALR